MVECGKECTKSPYLGSTTFTESQENELTAVHCQSPVNCCTVHSLCIYTYCMYLGLHVETV